MSRAVAFWTKEAAEAAGYEFRAESVPCCAYPSGWTAELDLWLGPDGRTYTFFFNPQEKCFVFWPCHMEEGEDADGDRYSWAEDVCSAPCYTVDLAEEGEGEE